MNPGYLSFLLYIICAVLISFGWKEELANGVPNKVLALFFFVWPVFYGIHLPFGDGVQVNLNFILLLCLVLAICASLSPYQAFAAVSGGLLLASVYLLLQYFLAAEPIFIMYRADVDITLLLAVTTVCLFRSPLMQIAALTTGLVAGHLLYDVITAQKMPSLLGDPAFYDHWWMTVFAARVFALIAAACVKGLRKLGEH